MKREYGALEDNEPDNSKNMIDPAEEHKMKKIIRSKSMARQKVICSKRYKKILNSSQFRPSIYIYGYWNSGRTKWINKPYLSYGKNSRFQQRMK